MALRLGVKGSPWQYFNNKNSDHPLQDVDEENVFPLYARTNRGLKIGCDFIVSALGVEPADGPKIVKSGRAAGLELEEGWLAVDGRFRTSEPGIYAAGDGCHIRPSFDRRSPHMMETAPSEWLQMRLWSQAKTMGQFAARNMHEDVRTNSRVCGQMGWGPYPSDPTMTSAFPFQLFTHVTRFFGFKVILLGR